MTSCHAKSSSSTGRTLSTLPPSTRKRLRTHTRLVPAFQETGVHVVIEATDKCSVTDQRMIPQLLYVAMQRTPLVGRGAEAHPRGVGAASISNLLDDHIIVGSGHGTATVGDHHNPVHL